MALDKQRILSELGSVMNQLQSSDCGCMNKMFSNSGECPQGNPLPTCGGCRRGCCPGHGYGVHYGNMSGGGDPSMNAGGMGGMPCGMGGMPGGMNRNGMGGGMPGMNMGQGMRGGMSGGGMNMGGGMGSMPESGMSDGMNMGGGMPGRGMSAMGRNIPAMYSDTYNYLNQNLMQPCVKEVYNDLNSITPENTIAANPLATQMGLPAPGSGGAMGNPNAMQNMGGNSGAMGGDNPMQNASGAPGGNPMGNMSGMGANIVNMMMSGGGGKPANMSPNPGSQLREPMLIDAPHSPHGQIGVTPMSQPTGAGNMGMDPNASQPGMGMPQMQNPTTQYVSQDNMYTPPNVTNVQGKMDGNMMPGAQGGMVPSAQGQMNPGTQGNMNPAAQQMSNRNRYGQHTPGMQKFHEMFPGTMQEGLNFDPMAIAIQMNPANQKMAAMDSIQKLMSGQGTVSMGKQKQQAADPNAAPTGQAGGQQMLQGQQQVAAPGATMQPNQQQLYTATGAPVMNQQGQQYQQVPQQGQQYQQVTPQQQLLGQSQVPQYQQPPQQVYTAQGAPLMNQQQVDPNTGYESGVIDPNAQVIPEGHTAAPGQAMQEQNVYNMSQNQQYQYNTLGQPVEMIPGDSFHRPEPPLPQTLYGDYRGNTGKGYGVKNTLSKTALAGSRSVGKTASKSQLQHIYRQYRASHSDVQQSIRPPPMQGGSASEGRLNTMQAAPQQAQPAMQIPMEKVGGDTIANNPVGQPMMTKVQQPMAGEVGDVLPATQPGNAIPGDALFEKSYGAIMQKNGRNGLQDNSYRPYRSTTGWSFHG